MERRCGTWHHPPRQLMIGKRSRSTNALKWLLFTFISLPLSEMVATRDLKRFHDVAPQAIRESCGDLPPRVVTDTMVMFVGSVVESVRLISYEEKTRSKVRRKGGKSSKSLRLVHLLPDPF